jgi:DNA-binding MarR family transcriptional regulator
VRQSHSTNLDRVIHDQTRLSIMSALAVNETLSFTELKAMTETTDGNLSVHARKLEDAGYLRSDKSFAGRTPRTDFTLTASGRRALTKYLDHMEALIRATRAPK